MYLDVFKNVLYFLLLFILEIFIHYIFSGFSPGLYLHGYSKKLKIFLNKKKKKKKKKDSALCKLLPWVTFKYTIYNLSLRNTTS